ncbi:NAD(P)/FAD-dependent oxidoreductase [Streptomyces uncialis]|uniref:NAD(P)/FAD-dependent oxidoreductase n=1 Tax=Streptomyces uncialis TaxID=1048205 RepID=UPI00380943F9
MVVVGGGAAGLAGALMLGRARRSVLVIDNGEPRNAPAEAMHGYLGQDGVPPARLLATGRAEVRGYGVRIASGTVVSAEPDEGGFRVTVRRPGAGSPGPGVESGTGTGAGAGTGTGTGSGSGAGSGVGAGAGSLVGAESGAGEALVRARRLLVTTGLVDELPPVPGLAELWGRDVLHCPYCHGWEIRDLPIGVLSTGPLAVHQALLWRQWSPDITLFLHTGPEPDEEAWERLAARGVRVVRGEVAGVEQDGERLSGLRLGDGTVIAVRALTVASGLRARSGVLDALGLEAVPALVAGTEVGSRIPAEADGRTPVAGVWAAGNVTGVTETVSGSAAAGARAGAAINADLVALDTRLAVAARRSPFGADGERAVARVVARSVARGSARSAAAGDGSAG